MPSNRLALPNGYRLENYQFTDALGKGGFGITYLAKDLQLNRQVAVKELLPDAIATRVNGTTVVAQSEAHEEHWSWARDRFLTEAQVVASFRHPNIVSVHRLIEANGTVYMVMDFLDGGSYEGRLAQIHTEADETSMRAVIEPLLDGLEEVHRAGLLHRDIKPDNVLFNHRGEPVLADFGAARQLIGQTISLTSIVTPGYSPFEQYQTREGLQGAWTDIYALGAMMARAITGKKPPPATDRYARDENEPLAAKPRPGYSKEFLKAVDAALRMEPRERPQSVASWRKTLVPAGKLPASALVLAAPKGGERWEVGTARKIAWKLNSEGARANIRSLQVELWKAGAFMEKLASGLSAAATEFAWSVPADKTCGDDYLIKLSALDGEGRIVSASTGGKFSLIPKRVVQSSDASKRNSNSDGETLPKIMGGVMWLVVVWFLFFGGWRLAWDKVFPHLPQTTITWMRQNHRGWLPSSEQDKLSTIDQLQLNKTLTERLFPKGTPSSLILSPLGPTSTRDLLKGIGTPSPNDASGLERFLHPKPSPTPFGGSLQPLLHSGANN